MKNLSIRVIALILTIVIMYACNPNLEDENLTTSLDEINTEELIKLGNANLKAQEILIEMLRNEPDLRKELLKVGVEDEGIMLKTLFDPTTESFQRLNPTLINFKNKFGDYFYERGNSSHRTSQENNKKLEELIQTLTDGNMELYMPYIEEEMLESDNITIVAATLENQGDEAEGYRVDLSGSKNRGNQPYDPPQLVNVNDDYASNNSTLILMPIDDGGGSGGGGYSGGGSSGGGSTGGSNTTEIYDSLYRMHVQVAYMRCKEQYDPFIGFNGNGGESEFKFFRAKPGYDFAEDKLKPGAYQIQAELTRRQIRDNEIVRQFEPWDYQWEDDELVQGFAIYEWDNTDNEIKINGSVKLKYEDQELSTGFEATFKSKHSILIVQDINRKYFYEDIKNEVNYGHGFDPLGNAWRKAGQLYYSLNTRNYFN